MPKFLTALAASVLTLALSFLVLPAQAAEGPTATTTYAFLNCNSREYTEGVSINGTNMTWATGSGSSRKYIRAKRMADLFKAEVRSSIYALTECDTQMLKDLAHLMGPNWKYVGGERVAHNKNGWLYDSKKWTPGKLSVTVLPGSQGRRLLQMGWFRNGVPGVDPMLSTATTHYSSGDPVSRDAQATAVMEKIGSAVRLFTADLNASSAPDGRDPCSITGPRWQLACLGYEDFGANVPSFTNYGKIANPLPLDTIATSKKAQSTNAIDVTWSRKVSTLPTLVSDHELLVAGVKFRTP